MYSRRHFIRLSSMLAGGIVVSTALTGCALHGQRRGLSAATFAHGVASGDPGANRVMLWSRATPGSGEATLDIGWELSARQDFTDLLRSGVVQTTAQRDYTIKVDVQDLAPGIVYYYRFLAGDGDSAVGRTKTLPVGSVEQVRLAVLSCSNYPAGYFYPYREASRVEELDAFLHLGDYFYEYGMGGYATERAVELGRALPADNAGELYTLGDYRRRYALYRTDPDLQALHAAAPCIAVWDDHEFANDAWMNGAQNHSQGEGDYQARKLAAMQAYYEWLPIRPPLGEDNPLIYRSFDFAGLLSLHMLDTRIIARDKPLEYDHYVDPASGRMDQEQFVADLSDPSRSLLGKEQLAWLAQQLAASRAPWQILGQQVLMGRMRMPVELLGTEDYSEIPALLRNLAALKSRQLAGEPLTAPEAQRLAAVTPYNLDAWDGYPVERERLYGMTAQQGARIVALAGDTHNAWYSRLTDRTGMDVGIELATSSVSSPGMENYFQMDEAGAVQMARVLPLLIDDLQYCNLHQRGFLLLDVSAEELVAEWRFVDSVTTPTYGAAPSHIERFTPGL